MPHQCVRCNILYDDGAKEILKGCPCGGKFFFYIKVDQIEKQQDVINLSQEEKEQIENDVYELMGSDKAKRGSPIVLDLESIRIIKPGKYELDLVHLFKKDPVIFKLDEGKYVIDLPQTFKQMKQKSGIIKKFFSRNK